MNKINCEIIEDVLPLYVEQMASKPTEEMVNAHVCTCESCQKKLRQLKSEITIPMEKETEPIKRIQKKLKKKNAVIAAASGLLALVLAILVGVHLFSPVLIDNYEDAVMVETDAEGNVSLILSEEVAGYSLEETGGNGVEGVYALSCWNTKWNQLFAGEVERVVSLEDKQITQIYYYSPKTYEKQGDVLIYNSEGAALSGGVITLPRLVLNYYMLFAGIVLVFGIFTCILLRKKDRKYILQKITLIPGAYLLSSILILSGKDDIYNVAYYFSGIMLLAIALYALAFYVWNRIVWRSVPRIPDSVARN